jgi:hypothetical protein
MSIFCLIVVAYSSFSAYPFVLMPPNDPIVSFVASKHIDPDTNTPATPGQVLLKWSMQKVIFILLLIFKVFSIYFSLGYCFDSKIIESGTFVGELQSSRYLPALSN